jgi:hypothetical protein
LVFASLQLPDQDPQSRIWITEFAWTCDNKRMNLSSYQVGMLFPQQRRKFRVTRKLNVCSSHDNRLTLIFPTLDGYVCKVYLSRGVRRRDNLMMHYECFLSLRFSDCLRKYTKDPVELCQNPASPYRRGDLCKGLAIAVVSQQQVLVNE